MATEARKKAEAVDRQGRFSTKNVSDYVPSMARPMVAYMNARPPRDDEEMDELTREVQRGMPKGRSTAMSSAERAARADVADAKQREQMGKAYDRAMPDPYGEGKAKGGMTKGYAGGGSASSRADGCAQHGRTRGMMR
jgi:hypothetical protein